MDLDYNESARSQLSVSAVSRSVVTQNACDSQSMYGDKAACLVPDRKQTREDGGGGGQDTTQPLEGIFQRIWSPKSHLLFA